MKTLTERVRERERDQGVSNRPRVRLNVRPLEISAIRMNFVVD